MISIGTFFYEFEESIDFMTSTFVEVVFKEFSISVLMRLLS